jgi:hypothetical protein
MLYVEEWTLKILKLFKLLTTILRHTHKHMSANNVIETQPFSKIKLPHLKLYLSPPLVEIDKYITTRYLQITAKLYELVMSSIWQNIYFKDSILAYLQSKSVYWVESRVLWLRKNLGDQKDLLLQGLLNNKCSLMKLSKATFIPSI